MDRGQRHNEQAGPEAKTCSVNLPGASPDTICTEFIYPPIPIRKFDWAAWSKGTEDEKMITGFGETKEIAIHDLLEQEREEME